jgi:uncharacterized membrane protein YhiD involved in acid resistance
MNNLFQLGDVAIVHPVVIVFNIILTLILALVISYVYRSSHKGLSYSQSFVLTLVIVSLITTVIMMVIGNNIARAFGLLGAFSIIRFRTAVKETKDTGYIFFALAEGMAVGTGSYVIAGISTLVISAIILVLYRTNFGSLHPKRFILSFIMNQSESAQTSFEPVFKKYLKYSLLLNIKVNDDSTASEMMYDVDFMDEKEVDAFVKSLSGIAGVTKIRVIASTQDIEY